MPPGVVFGKDFLLACLNPSPGNRLDSATKDFESALQAEPDPERRYAGGTLLAYCGQKGAAVRAITSAINNNYCAYQALQHDPLLAKLRDTPEFAQLLSTAQACQTEFLSKRSQTAP
jgi:hypothetical protein